MIKKLFILLYIPFFSCAGFDDKIVSAAKGIIQQTDNSARFVPIIIARDAYDGEESDGEEDDEFSECDFEAYSEAAFNGQWKDIRFARIDKPASLQDMRQNGISPKAQKIAENFAETGFGTSSEESLAIAKENLAVTVLSNRLLSISRSRNYAKADPSLVKREASPVSQLHNPRCHLVPVWYDKNTAKKSSNGKHRDLAPHRFT